MRNPLLVLVGVVAYYLFLTRLLRLRLREAPR